MILCPPVPALTVWGGEVKSIKPLFTQGPSITTRLVVFSLLSIVLMMVDHRQHSLEGLRGTLSVVVYPLQYMVNAPIQATRWLNRSLATHHHLLEENDKLRAQDLLLKARLQKLAALEAENQRLRQLLGSSVKLGDQVLIAELLAVNTDPYTHEIVINKGSDAGVYTGQPVLDADGVMGQVVHAGPLTSNVLLITDPNQAVPVQDNRNGLRTIAVGTGSDLLSLPYLPNNADIRVGDLLVTSGLGGYYPFGYPVAVVKRVERNPSHSFAVVSAAPTAHLNRSREVLLVMNRPPSRQTTGAARTVPTGPARAP